MAGRRHGGVIANGRRVLAARAAHAVAAARRREYIPPVLNCQHHIQWIRRAPDGLHQCILCHQAVSRKDVYPKFEDLSAEAQRRWEEHEATRPPPAAASDQG
jgi:hypothetical protein